MLPFAIVQVSADAFDAARRRETMNGNLASAHAAAFHGLAAGGHGIVVALLAARDVWEERHAVTGYTCRFPNAQYLEKGFRCPRSSVFVDEQVDPQLDRQVLRSLCRRCCGQVKEPGIPRPPLHVILSSREDGAPPRPAGVDPREGLLPSRLRAPPAAPNVDVYQHAVVGA